MLDPKHLDDDEFHWRGLLGPRGPQDVSRIATMLWFIFSLFTLTGFMLDLCNVLDAAFETSATLALAVVALHWSIVAGRVQILHLHAEVRSYYNRLDRAGLQLGEAIMDLRTEVSRLQGHRTSMGKQEVSMEDYYRKLDDRAAREDEFRNIIREVSKRLPRPHGQIAFTGALIIGCAEYLPLPWG